VRVATAENITAPNALWEKIDILVIKAPLADRYHCVRLNR